MKETGIGYNRERASTLMLLFCVTLSVVFAEEIADAARVGLRLCASSIIPAVFPFMVLSDLIVAYSPLEKSGFLRRSFERLFGISGAGITAFISGIICGFPLGVKSTVDLCREGHITKEEAERLIGFSNNTGPAFIIAGIGASMRGSLRDGIVLYAVLVLSAVLVGILFRKSGKKAAYVEIKRKNRFDLIQSVQNAGENTLNICSFIIFFSVIVGIVSSVLKSTPLLAVILPFLEVGNAASFLAEARIDRALSLALTAFATAFSGLSVHLQALSLLSGSGISRRKYFVMKLLQGLFAMTFIIIFENIF